jgi:hypothetical protein
VPVATTSTTTRPATAAAAASRSIASRPAVLRRVDSQRASSEFELVFRFQHLLRVFVVQLDERKPLGAARISIHDDAHRVDLAKWSEQLF